MDLATLPTPAALVDLARVERNAARMRELAGRHGVVLRPHVKTHKTVAIARLQHGGAEGPITVSTLAEAEGFLAAGFDDITYAVPLEPGKFARVLDLARRIRLQVITADPEVATALADAAAAARVRLGVLVEIDCGDGRSGADPAGDAVLAVARTLAAAPALDFRGVLTHAGHAYACTGDDAIAAAAHEERNAAVGVASRLRAAGLAVPTVSIGSTPTMAHAEDLGGVTEIRPGNYVLFDAFQAAHGNCASDDAALTVLAAVVHRDSARRRIVLDAGAIALSKDSGPRDVDPGAGYGRVLRLDGSDTGARVERVTQEHGEVSLPSEVDLEAFPPGARVRVLANHSCLTAAQHAVLHAVEGQRVVAVWPTLRGW